MEGVVGGVVEGVLLPLRLLELGHSGVVVVGGGWWVVCGLGGLGGLWFGWCVVYGVWCVCVCVCVCVHVHLFVSVFCFTFAEKRQPTSKQTTNNKQHTEYG